MEHWITDFNRENYKVRVQCIYRLNLDIIGVAESSLIGKNTLDIPGNEWLGHKRKNISVWAKVLGSGGVVLLMAKRLLENVTFQTLDKSYERILWINMSSKCSGFACNICVCYLPCLHMVPYDRLMLSSI